MAASDCIFRFRQASAPFSMQNPAWSIAHCPSLVLSLNTDAPTLQNPFWDGSQLLRDKQLPMHRLLPATAFP